LSELGGRAAEKDPKPNQKLVRKCYRKRKASEKEILSTKTLKRQVGEKTTGHGNFSNKK